MGANPEQTNEVAFIKSAKDIATLCLKNKKGELFTRFVANIPFEDHPLKNGKEIRKRQTWRCKQCKKTFKTKDSHREHEDTCNIVRNSDKNGSGDRADSNCTKENKSSEGQNKKDADNAKTKKHKCMFCKKERVRIYDHYLVKHKIDYNLWVQNLNTLNNCDAPKCPQCKESYTDVASLKEHFTEYHNIDTLRKTKKRRPKAKNAKERELKETAPVAQDEESVRNSPAIQRDVQTTNGPATQDRNIIGRPNAQDERDRVPTQYFCKRTRKFVDASSNESQHASAGSNRSASKRQSDPSHSNDETVKSMKLRKLGDGEHAAVPNSNNGGITMDQRMRDDTEFQSNGEGHAPQKEAGQANGINNEERRDDKADEERRKSRFKSLWHEYFQRMLVADERGKQILYDKFHSVYNTLAPKGAVCYKRLNSNFVSYRRVDVVSSVITETSTTYQVGVVTTKKKVTELKVIKCYTD